MMNFAAAVSMNLVSARMPRAVLGARALAACTALVLGALASAPVAAQGIYYQCPGNVFTNTISAKEADAKGCKSREAVQVTTIPAPAPRARAAAAAPSGSASRVDAQEQKARDSDSRRILEDELKKAEGQLDTLKKEYNNGEPERQGNEKNYQKYLDRVADMKSAIGRKESDIAALKREIAKQPQ